MVGSPQKLADDLADFKSMATQADQPGLVTAMGGLNLGDPGAARADLDEYRALGVDRFVCGLRYETLDEYQAQLEALKSVITS